MNNIEIQNAELIMPFRNFSGKPSKYNKEGDRSFAVYISEEVVEDLVKDGWNVKTANNGRPYLNVAVKFAYRPPEIYVGTNPKKMKKLTEEVVGELDWADISSVDLSIRPRPYEVNDKKGVKAYLAEMYVIINKSSFAERYSSDVVDDDMPF